MFKRLTIFIIFFTAFTIVLAHDLVPHHHDIESSEHNDKDHEDDSPISDLFSHFQHLTIANENVFSQLAIGFKKINGFNPHKELITAFVFYFFKSGEQDPLVFHDYPQNTLPISHLLAFSLRGPPSFSV